MSTRKQFLRQLWKDIINLSLEEHWIDNLIRSSETNPRGSFSETGIALKRLLALGASRRDLSLLNRWASYEAVFQTLYMFEDPGVDEGDRAMLHESLLSADPSGKEGREGSSPERRS